MAKKGTRNKNPGADKRRASAETITQRNKERRIERDRKRKEKDAKKRAHREELKMLARERNLVMRNQGHKIHKINHGQSNIPTN